MVGVKGEAVAGENRLRREVHMSDDKRDVLDVLKFELNFLEQGGYGNWYSTPWGPASLARARVNPTMPPLLAMSIRLRSTTESASGSDARAHFVLVALRQRDVPCVIDVQVCDEDRVDIFRLEAGGGEFAQKRAGSRTPML